MLMIHSVFHTDVFILKGLWVNISFPGSDPKHLLLRYSLYSSSHKENQSCYLSLVSIYICILSVLEEASF